MRQNKDRARTRTKQVYPPSSPLIAAVALLAVTMKQRSPPSRLVRARKPEFLIDLHGWGDDGFEEICCDLFFDEVGLKNPERYGHPWRKQFGADIVAERRDGTGIDALSCKCYQAVRRGEIRTFVKEFLDHWDTHWATQRVRRFILCIACDLRGHERQAEIRTEKQRFKALGIEFEVWAQRELSMRVRRNPALARQFYEPFPATEASPPTLQVTTGGPPVLIPNAVISQIGSLQSLVEQAVATTLNTSRNLLLRGEPEKARELLLTIRGDSVQWSSLTPVLQARLLRQLAVHALNRRLFEECRTLLNEANTLASEGEPRVEALLEFRQRGPEAALRVLAWPTSKDGAMLRAGLLIEADRISEAEVLLQEWNALKEVDAEWHRLAAFIACSQRQPHEALKHVLTAERLAPDWVHLLELGGIVRYACALSAAVPFRIGPVPEPVSIDLARSDDESQAYLHHAAERFSSLCECVLDPGSQQRWRLWKFACEALMVDRQDQAQAECLRLITETPVPAVALFWALTNGYALPPDMLRRLEQQLRGEQPLIDDLQAAVALAERQRDFKKAAAILARHGTRFSAPQETEVVRTWSARIAHSRSRKHSPTFATDALDRVDAALQAARISGDPAIVQDVLGTIADRPDVIYTVCRILAGQKQWAPIVTQVDRLVRDVANAEAVRLAAYALYNDQQYERVQRLLEEHQSLFPRKRLPPELSRLQAFAATKRGDLPTALPIASSLAMRTGEFRDRALLVDLLIHTGDVARAVPHLRDLLPTRHWTAQELMRWVPGISTEERGLAQTLVLMAMERDDSLKQSAALLDWSWRLGLDRKASEFLGRIQANETAAKSIQLRSASLDEIVEFMRRQQETNIEMGGRYRRGEAPIHVIVNVIRANLAIVWASAFANDGSVSDLFIRSGNRPTEFFGESTPKDVRTLYLDVTAVLTIDQLDLWQALASSGITLAFPHSLPQALQGLEQHAYPAQPSRFEVMTRILDQTDQGAIRVWVTNVVPPERAVYVRFERSETDSSPQLTVGELVGELVRRGGITAAQANALRDTAAIEPIHQVDTRFALIEQLVFEANTIDVAVDAGLLEALQSRFAIFIESEYQARCRTEVQHMRQGIEVAKQLASVRRRLAEGITSGTYRILPEPMNTLRSREHTLLRDLLCAPLIELFKTPQTPGTWIWIDDRYCTSYTYINGNPIVSTFEVLRHLKSTRQFDESTYYGLLGRMRASRVQVLPVSADEVLFHLRDAPYDDHRLTETLPLQRLRMNFNRLLELESDLRLDESAVAGKPVPERPCLLEAFRVSRESLQRVWEANDVTRGWQIAASDWIWEAMRAVHFTRLPAASSPEGRERMHQLCLLLFLAVALSLPAKAHDVPGHSPRKAYLQWLTAHSADLSASVDSATIKQTALQLSGYLIKDVLDIDPAELPGEVGVEFLRTFVLSFVQDLPEALRDALLSIPEFVAAAQPALQDLVSIETFSFEANQYWETLAQAWRGTDARLETIAGNAFDVHASDGLIEFHGDAESFRLSFPEFALLNDCVEERRAFLSQEPWLIDASEGEAKALLSDIAEPTSPAARLRTYAQVRERTVAGRYALLDRLLAQHPTPSFGPDVLLPAGSANYVSYLSLVTTAEHTVDWEASAQALLRRLPPEEALIRWQGLPIRLPRPLWAAWNKLDEERQRGLIERLTGPGKTPMSLLRATELIAASRTEVSDTESLSLLSTMLAEWNQHSQLLTTMLEWAERAAQRDPTWNALSIAERLACLWSHADRVLSMFRAQRISPSLLLERFPKLHPRWIEIVLPFDAAYEGDIAAPRRMNGPVLLMAGLTAAFGERAPAGWESLLQVLQSILMEDYPNGRYPIREMFEDRRYGANALGSFLSEDTPEWLATIIATDTFPALTATTRERIRSEAIEGFEIDISSAPSWGLLHMIGFEWLSVEEQHHLSESIRKLPSPPYGSESDSRAILFSLSTILPHFDETTRAGLQVSFLSWMTYLRGTHPHPIIEVDGNSEVAKNARVVLELALALCRRGSLSDTVSAMAQLFPRMSNSWPALAMILRDTLARCLDEIPANAAQPLWPAYIGLRSRP